MATTVEKKARRRRIGKFFLNVGKSIGDAYTGGAVSRATRGLGGSRTRQPGNGSAPPPPPVVQASPAPSSGGKLPVPLLVGGALAAAGALAFVAR